MGIERSGLMARASAMAGEGLGGDGGVIRRDRPTASTGWSERWPAGLGLDRAAGSAGRGGRGATLLRPRLEGRRHDGGDPPPMKWSALWYGFEPGGRIDVEEATQA